MSISSTPQVTPPNNFEESHGAGLADYLAVLRVPGAAAPAVASLLARLPIAMGSMSLLIYVERVTGSFADAGLVAGGALLGIAVSSVLQGKLIDRYGAGRTLLVAVLLYFLFGVLAIVAIEARTTLGVLFPLALIFGLCQPALATASRGLWAELIRPGRLREAALTYEAISLESFFILGPAIAGVLVALPWPGVALSVTITLFLVGTVTFCFTKAVRSWKPQHPEAGGAGVFGVLAGRGIPTLMILVCGLGMAFGIAEVAIPAWALAEDHIELGGVLLGVWSLAGVVFGLLYAIKPWPSELAKRAGVLSVIFSVLVSFAALAPNLIWLAVLLVVSGSLITPQSTLHSLLVDRLAPQRYAAEAFGWVLTAILLGVALGQAFTGHLVELFGPQTAIAFAGIPTLVAGIYVWFARGSLAPR